MSKYVDLLGVKRYMGIVGTGAGTQDDALIQECIDRAEWMIDNFTRRAFVGTSGTRSFSRYEQDRVKNNAFYLQEDLFSLTALTLGDGQSVPVGSVWLEPREGPPYRIIRLRSSYVYVWNTDTDMHVVGTWGYGTHAPYDIAHATVRLASQLFRQKDATPQDVAGFEEAGVQQMPRGLPRDVYDILLAYRSRSGGVV